MLSLRDTLSRGWSIFLGSFASSGWTVGYRRAVLCRYRSQRLLWWLVLFAGVAHLVYAWSERGAGAIIWQILIGIVYVIAALYMLVLPVAGVVALTLVLTFYIAA